MGGEEDDKGEEEELSEDFEGFWEFLGGFFGNFRRFWRILGGFFGDSGGFWGF